MITTIKLISTHLCMRVCVQVNTLGLPQQISSIQHKFPKQPYSPCCTLGFQNIFIFTTERWTLGPKSLPSPSFW